MFTPENELEQAMLRASMEASSAPEFYRLLLASGLVVLGSKGERLAIDVIKNGNRFFHPIFTSPARLDTFSSDPLPHFILTGRELLEASQGAQFIINPRSSLAKTLFPDEITWCLQNFRVAEFAVYKPDINAAQLIRALCVLFASRTQIHSARLTCVGMPSNPASAHIVIGIEADGEVPRLVEEIFAAAAVTNPKLPVDVASLDTKQATHPLHRHLLTVEPFFKRMQA